MMAPPPATPSSACGPRPMKNGSATGSAQPDDAGGDPVAGQDVTGRGT